MESFGYCRVSIVLRDLNPRSFIDLFPLYFIKLCQNIHPKTPLKCDFSIWAGPNTFTFWSANFQFKLAPLILYTTLVYTSTLKSSLKDISNIRYSNQKIITLVPWRVVVTLGWPLRPRSLVLLWCYRDGWSYITIRFLCNELSPSWHLSGVQ